MKFMLTVDWAKTELDEVGAKFLGGEDVDPPAGVELISRWHDLSSRQAWLVVETADTKAVQSWMSAWSDFIDWETYMIMDDAECQEVLRSVLDD